MVLVRHGFVYLLARGLPAAINLLAVAVFTRILGPSEYGSYTLFVALSGIVNTGLFWWLRLGLLRFYPTYVDHERPRLMATVGRVFLAVSTVIVLGGTVLAILLSTERLGQWCLLIGVTIAQAAYELNLDVLTARLETSRYSVTTVLKALIFFLLGSILLYIGWGARGLLMASLLSLAIPTVMLVRHGWSGLRQVPLERPILRDLLKYGLPLTATFAFSFVLYTLDRVLLGLLKGESAAGLYSVAYDLTQQSIILLMSVVNTAAYPLILRAFEEQGDQGASNELKRSGLGLILLGLPAVVGLSLLAPQVADLFMGAEYREAATVIIPIVAVSALLQGLKSFHFDLAFHIRHRTIGQLWPWTAAVVCNAILNLAWIPRWGGLGAAWATVIAYGVALLVSWWVGRNLFTIPVPWNEWGKVTLATLLMAVALVPTLDHHGLFPLVGQTTWGASVYATGLLLLNVGNMRQRISAIAQGWRGRNLL